jgi:hypothetical protein
MLRFLNEIADLKFTLEPDQQKQPETSDDLVAWYEKNFARAAERVRALTPEHLLTPVDFYGVFHLPVVLYLGLQSQHPSPGSTLHLSPPHGLQLPLHRRWQLRRTLARQGKRRQRRLKLLDSKSLSRPTGRFSILQSAPWGSTKELQLERRFSAAAVASGQYYGFSRLGTRSTRPRHPIT